MGVEHGKGGRPVAETEVSIINGIEADRFSDQGFAHEEHVTPPADVATCAHATNRHAGRVLDAGQPQGILPGGPLIDGDRGHLAERFMRSHMVVLMAEPVEGTLLGAHVMAGRSCSLFLERAVHSFMASVLLRAAGFDALRCDAELDPPDGEPGESSEANGAPLSVRIAAGSPYCLNAAIQMGLTPSAWVDGKPWQRRMNRLNESVIVSG
jgi:hypothetical protein